MPTISITFNNPLNTSLQIGDTVYYVPTNSIGNFDTAQQPNMIEIGQVTNIINPGGPVVTYSTTLPNNYVSPNISVLTFNNPLPSPSDIQIGMSVSSVVLAPNTIVTAWNSQIGTVSLSPPTTIPAPLGTVFNFSTPTEIHVFNSVNPIPTPNPGDFIMFAKDRVANTSGIIGYYADIKLINNSTNKAEMFAISSGVIESSK